jgi:hypothetical protein
MRTHSEVSFVVGSTIHELGDPEEVTKHLEIEPSTVVWCDIQARNPATDRLDPYRTWMWLLRSPLGDEASATQRLNSLLEALRPLRDRIVSIPPRYWRHVSCQYESTPNDFMLLSDAGIIVPVESMRSLANLDLKLVFSARVWTPDAFKVNIENKLAEQGAARNSRRAV